MGRRYLIPCVLLFLMVGEKTGFAQDPLVPVLHPGWTACSTDRIFGRTGYQPGFHPSRIRGGPERQTGGSACAGAGLSEAPLRENDIRHWESVLGSVLKGAGGGAYEKYNLALWSGGHPLRDYVPNAYRSARDLDKDRLVGKWKRKEAPLVRNLDAPQREEAVLAQNNIALWHSHGWYYEASLDRWEWQRARLFQTVEDLYPLSYVLQMLVPMLENAGAEVFLPGRGTGRPRKPSWTGTAAPGQGF
ncbi:MAG: hypothetical protein R2751_11715 [Bacteroidales bacterium]